ncbi:MAG TPA: hypothetical protein VLK89_00765 [Solirubrobacterales bacterium]|nr:hypothetical protein [Solirubrobacterales bacterium]
MSDRGLLLDQVLDQYRASGDFNGFYIGPSNSDLFAPAIALTQAGLVQVVSEKDYPNPHIRPWPSKRSLEEQVRSINELTNSDYGLCLYPTPTALEKHPVPDAYPEEPYRQAMANGRGTLEQAFFRFDVLEQYRNDPRFEFSFSDSGCDVVVSDQIYRDDNELEHDKIIMDHIGFAYDLSGYNVEDVSSPIIRRVCAFYGDLAKLTSVHQRRWQTYEVSADGLSPHPVWWMQQMGHFGDGLGPFERFMAELKAINELSERALGEPLFANTKRPREFGWILRPSQQEWDAFIQLLDKMLSENLRSSVLTAAGAPKQNSEGQPLGSLGRLAALMEGKGIRKTLVGEVLAPLREVRKARSKPAHALRENIDDRSFVHRQVDLIERVSQSLTQLRWWWQSHPANREWEPPDYLTDDATMYRM